MADSPIALGSARCELCSGLVPDEGCNFEVSIVIEDAAGDEEDRD